MSRYLLARFSNLLVRLEQLLFRGGLPPAPIAYLGVGNHASTNLPIVQQTHKHVQQDQKKYDLKALLGDSILWAVPKHRRTIEKRLNRKYGHPDYVWKPLKLKTNLRTCNQCGHDHEVGVLCPHCYNKVRTETELMQEKIQSELGLAPIEQDVIVLYEGEKKEQPSELLNGKRIVEMQKPRPMWFTKNLLQKTTQPANTSEVKPSDLG